MTSMTKYEMLMNRIEVTPAMKERILRNIAAKEQRHSLRSWRMPLIFAAALIVMLAIFVPRLTQQPDVSTGSGPSVQEYASISELEKAAGWKIAAQFTLPFEPADTAYTLIDSEVAEIVYTGADGARALYRTSLTMEDPSGEYGPFASDTSYGRYRLRGYETGTYSLAIWKDGNVFSALSLEKGYAEEAWTGILPN